MTDRRKLKEEVDIFYKDEESNMFSDYQGGKEDKGELEALKEAMKFHKEEPILRDNFYNIIEKGEELKKIKEDKKERVYFLLVAILIFITISLSVILFKIQVFLILQLIICLGAIIFLFYSIRQLKEVNRDE